jgi:hypothetical protein
MPIVLSETPPLAFVHIPKCAGTTVSEQLIERLDPDPFFASMEWEEHPVLGRYQPGHMTLPELAIAFPDIIDRLRRVPAFAVIREPRSRFRSALLEYLTNVRGIPHDQIPADQIRAEIDTVIGACRPYMAGTAPRIEGLYVHFNRQSDFIDLNGERIVDRLYPIERLDDLARDLNEVAGVTIDAVQNRRPARSLSRRSAGVRKSLAKAKTVLPLTVYEKARSAMLPLFHVKRDPHLEDALWRPEVEAFVEQFYADDFAIFASNVAGEDRPKSVIEQRG